MTQHTATRKPHALRFPGLERHVTYDCNDCNFTVTDTGQDARREWLRHELASGRVEG